MIDQTWMTYNPYIIAGLGAILVGIIIIVLANEVAAHRIQSYDSDTRIYVNLACIIAAFLCLIAIVAFGIGLMNAYGDYTFKTKSPEAATYQLVINYLYYGVYR